MLKGQRPQYVTYALIYMFSDIPWSTENSWKIGNFSFPKRIYDGVFKCRHTNSGTERKGRQSTSSYTSHFSLISNISMSVAFSFTCVFHGLF